MPYLYKRFEIPIKVVVTFYLRLRDELLSFPNKNEVSEWLTKQVRQPIRDLVFGKKCVEFISLSQIKGYYNFSWDGQNILNLFIPMTCKVVPTFVVSCVYSTSNAL